MAKSATKYSQPKVSSVAKIHGGKSYICRRLLDLYPPITSIIGHVEVCAGLAAMTLNLPAATRAQPRWDVYNDVDSRLGNLFQMCRDFPDEMTVRLGLTPYSEAEFLRARDPATWRAAAEDPLERARLMYVLLRMSWGGQGVSWSWTKDRTRRGIADVVAGHLGAIDDNLPGIIARCREWQFDTADWIECLLKYDKPGVMHYLDPPYLHSVRADGSKQVYAYEMTPEQHEEMLCCLTGQASKHAQYSKQATYSKPQGFVMISGYDSDMYNTYLHDWGKHSIDIANHAAGGKTKRRMRECVWINYQLQ